MPPGAGNQIGEPGGGKNLRTGKGCVSDSTYAWGAEDAVCDGDRPLPSWMWFCPWWGKLHG